VGQLLGKGPVHVLQVGARNHIVVAALCWLQLDLQVDVIGRWDAVFEKIRQGCRILLWTWNQEGLKSIHGHNPGRHGGTKVLAEEGSKGNVLPGLNVTGTPVVHEDNTEHVVLGVLNSDGLAQVVASTDKEGLKGKKRMNRQVQFLIPHIPLAMAHKNFARGNTTIKVESLPSRVHNPCGQRDRIEGARP